MPWPTAISAYVCLRLGPENLAQLARSFNRMTEELERSDRQRRNMTADVAHELRTPLHIIQGNLEGILDHVYEPTDEQIGATLDETKALARLVEDLQTISLAEAGQLPLHRGPVNIGELLLDIITSFSLSAEASGIQLVLEPGLGEPAEAQDALMISTVSRVGSTRF